MTSHSIYDSWRKGEGGLQALFLFTVRLITTPNVLPVQKKIIRPFGGFPCDEPIKKSHGRYILPPGILQEYHNQTDQAPLY